jgi:LysM repeat protein
MNRKLQLLLLCSALLLMLVWAPSAAHAQGCSGVTHVVQTGDNLYRIGLQYGVTWDQIAAANGIANPNTIYIAQTLCIPTSSGGNVGTGGAVVAPVGGPSGTTGAVSGTVSGPVQVNSGTYIIERSANSPVISTAAGTIDANSGYDATATVILDATNNLLNIVASGHIPNSWVTVYVSDTIGDLSGGRIGYVMTDNAGVADGYVTIPFLSQEVRQYVMIRSYDGRLTWSFFDLGARFP